MDEVLIMALDRWPVLGTVVMGAVAAHSLALFIVNLTPTPRDNRVYNRVYRVVEWAAGIVDSRAKEPGGRN